MIQGIFVNLPVKNLSRSMDFFRKMGFAFNEKFTDDKAASMMIGDNIYAMLLADTFFKTFTPKKLCDASEGTEVLVALSCGSRAEVDELEAKALAAGGREPRPPQDLGFMYGRDFEDLDGHIWELFYMEPSAVASGPPRA